MTLIKINDFINPAVIHDAKVVCIYQRSHVFERVSISRPKLIFTLHYLSLFSSDLLLLHFFC